MFGGQAVGDQYAGATPLPTFAVLALTPHSWPPWKPAFRHKTRRNLCKKTHRRRSAEHCSAWPAGNRAEQWAARSTRQLFAETSRRATLQAPTMRVRMPA